LPKLNLESFLKSFLLFFLTIELFLSFIFYNYALIEKEHLRENLFFEMKNYSYLFEGDKFTLSIAEDKGEKLYELLESPSSLYIAIDTKDDNADVIRISYPKKAYLKEVDTLYEEILLRFVLLSIVAVLIAFVFSFYALYPLQNAYTILKEFMKDMLHDLNTPLSTIKLNLSMIEKKDDEIEMIEQSVNTLEMLHKNLDNYLKETPPNISPHHIEPLLMQQIEFFQSLYDYLEWQIDIEDELLKTDYNLLSRVIYNLLHNATKYNTQNGFISITYSQKKLLISNASYGIKRVEKVFDRFYKEGDRGLGIGLHIVSKILKQLGNEYNMSVDKNGVVSFELTLK